MRYGAHGKMVSEMTRDELKALIAEAITESFPHHHCAFSSEERALIRDMAAGAKLAKKWTIRSIVFGILIAAASIMVKAASSFKPFGG